MLLLKPVKLAGDPSAYQRVRLLDSTESDSLIAGVVSSIVTYGIPAWVALEAPTQHSINRRVTVTYVRPNRTKSYDSVCVIDSVMPISIL